jgi:AraC-like DNA-binding protein
MRTQSQAERLQRIVILSDINLYHLDRDLNMIEKYVVYSEEKKLTEEGEAEIKKLIREEHFQAPVIWEGNNGDLIGLVEEDENSYYVTAILGGEKLVKLLAFLEVADRILFDRDIFQKDILVRHNVSFDETKSQVQDVIETDKTPVVHASFHDEQEFVTAIEQGDRYKVHEYLEKGFIQTFRRSSPDMLTHYRNVGITAIALASRAAIRGGVPSAMAYDFSNTMMKQVDKIPTVSQMYAWICSVFNRYTQMVVEAKKVETNNNMIEQCRQYVLAHYKEKITVGDIADYIGRSPNYVSAVFKEKTGETLVHYINREKIGAAKNILKYSEMDVSAVSNFLSFSSQAYFGRVFKELTGMTPKRYKDQNRVKELSFETSINK